MTFFSKKRTEKEKNIHISRCLRQAHAACGRNSKISPRKPIVTVAELVEATVNRVSTDVRNYRRKRGIETVAELVEATVSTKANCDNDGDGVLSPDDVVVMNSFVHKYNAPLERRVFRCEFVGYKYNTPTERRV